VPRPWRRRSRGKEAIAEPEASIELTEAGHEQARAGIKNGLGFHEIVVAIAAGLSIEDEDGLPDVRLSLPRTVLRGSETSPPE
jgi:hypothetical protein